MTSQHPHPHQQQQQQQQTSSQYYNHSQISSTSAIPHQSQSPAIYLQHPQSATASSYPSISSHHPYGSQSQLPPSSSADQYYSGLLQNVPSSLVRYATPAQAGSPPPVAASYLPLASGSTSGPAATQAQPGVSSRIVSSLQSLVSLLEKQNTKLDKHDEHLKTLSEGVNQIKTETAHCTLGIESFSKTMSKKLKTMTDTASKTLQEDIARSLEKDLDKLRKETSELGKISKTFTSNENASFSKLADISTAQAQLLQAFTSNQETVTGQADSIVDRISDAQLDLLHRLSDQFRLVTASITTSASATRQFIEQSENRQNLTQQHQVQQLFNLFQSIAARPSPILPVEVSEEEEKFIMPTPPTSQMSRALQGSFSRRADSALAPSDTYHRCSAVQCTSCLIQVNTHQSQGTETQMSTVPVPAILPSAEVTTRKDVLSPASPVGQAKSPPRSTSSHRRRPLKALQPFIMKKRKILQSDDEAEEDAEHETINESTTANPAEQQQPSSLLTLHRHAVSRERVEAWRFGTRAAQGLPLSDEHTTIVNELDSIEQQQKFGAQSAEKGPVSQEPQPKKKPVKRATKAKKDSSSSPAKRRKTARQAEAAP